MENTNTPVMPDSMIVAQAQNALKQVIQTYPLPAYMWQLIVGNLMHEVNNLYSSQLMADQDAYQRQIDEMQAQVQAASRSTAKKKQKSDATEQPDEIIFDGNAEPH